MVTPIIKSILKSDSNIYIFACDRSWLAYKSLFNYNVVFTSVIERLQSTIPAPDNNQWQWRLLCSHWLSHSVCWQQYQLQQSETDHLVVGSEEPAGKPEEMAGKPEDELKEVCMITYVEKFSVAFIQALNCCFLLKPTLWQLLYSFLVSKRPNNVDCSKWILNFWFCFQINLRKSLMPTRKILGDFFDELVHASKPVD